jgi:hypothetical protein
MSDLTVTPRIRNKMDACKAVWQRLPEGEYTAQFIAAEANKMNVSSYVHAADAYNALRALGVPKIPQGHMIPQLYRKRGKGDE